CMARLVNGRVYEPDTATGLTYNAGINGPVHDFIHLGDKLYLAGKFSVVDGQTRRNVACLDTSLHVQAWTADADDEAFCIRDWGSNLLGIGGAFHTVNGDTAYGAALVRSDSGLVRSWNPMFDGAVYAIESWYNGTLFAGGSFSGANGVLR